MSETNVKPAQPKTLIQWRGHIAGRHHGEGSHDYCEDTRLFGFWWWTWLPRMHWNGGTMRDACTDITASWLCFAVSLTLWWRSR